MGVNAIVQTHTHTKDPRKIKIGGYTGTDNIETCVLDSGACDAVIPLNAFSNTATTKTGSYGDKYLGCGGESTTKYGEKHVMATDSIDAVHNVRFAR